MPNLQARWKDKLKLQLQTGTRQQACDLGKYLEKALERGVAGRPDLFDVWLSATGAVIVKSRLEDLD